MEKLATLASAALLLLAAACNPADSVSQARAQPRTASAALYPAVAPDARDGQVHEYH